MIWSRSLPLLFLVVCSEATFWRLASSDNCTLGYALVEPCTLAINEVKTAKRGDKDTSSLCETFNKECSDEVKSCLLPEDNLQIAVEACEKNQTVEGTTTSTTPGPPPFPPVEPSKNETSTLSSPPPLTEGPATPETTTTTTQSPSIPGAETTTLGTPEPSVTVAQTTTELPEVTPGYSADCNSRIIAAGQAESVRVFNLALLPVRTQLSEIFSAKKICRFLNWATEVREGLQVIAQYCSTQEAAQQRQEIINARTKYNCDRYEKIDY